MSIRDKMTAKSEDEILKTLSMNKNAASIFKQSVRHNFKPGIKLALERGAVNYPSLLAYFAREGNLKVVKLLIKEGADIGAKDNKALCESIRMFQFHVAEFLLMKGADINKPKGKPLLIALFNGHIGIIQMLQYHGATLDQISPKKIEKELPYFNEYVTNLLKENGVI